MDWFEKIKIYYEMGLWDIERVKNAVIKAKLQQNNSKKLLNRLMLRRIRTIMRHTLINF